MHADGAVPTSAAAPRPVPSQPAATSEREHARPLPPASATAGPVESGPTAVLSPSAESVPPPGQHPAAQLSKCPAARTSARRRPVILALAGVSAAATLSAATVLGVRRFHHADADPRRLDAAPTATGDVTRAAFAVALHRWAGAPAVAATAEMFTDMPQDPSTADAVRWLAVRGGLVGDDQLRVRPEEPLTVGELREGLTALLPGIALDGLAGGPDALITASHLDDALEAAQAVVAS